MEIIIIISIAAILIVLIFGAYKGWKRMTEEAPPEFPDHRFQVEQDSVSELAPTQEEIDEVVNDHANTYYEVVSDKGEIVTFIVREEENENNEANQRS